MNRFITVPVDVVPLLYSGLELKVWRLAEELDGAFETRDSNPAWFEGPIDCLDHARELLRVIDWPRDRPPVASILEIDTHRDALVSALHAELETQRDHREVAGNSAELRGGARRAIAAIDGFLADLPALEAQAVKPGEPFTRPDGIERAIVLQVLRDDHHERWTRKELKRELRDVKGKSIDKALRRLAEEGAVELDEGYVWPSRCAQYLNALGMVSV